MSRVCNRINCFELKFDLDFNILFPHVAARAARGLVADHWLGSVPLAGSRGRCGCGGQGPHAWSALAVAAALSDGSVGFSPGGLTGSPAADRVGCCRDVVTGDGLDRVDHLIERCYDSTFYSI